MKPRRNSFITLWLFLAAGSLAASCARAGDIEVTFDVQPRILQLGEAATCTITVRGAGNPPRPNLPAVDGFRVQGTGQSSNFSLGPNGAVRSTSFQYRLVPTKTGNLTVGPFDYKINGQSATLPAVQVKVMTPGSAAPSGQNKSTDLSDLLFAKIEATKTNVYNQEGFDVYLSVYSRGLQMGREVTPQGWPTSGFTFGALEELRGTREVVKGQVFDVRRFRTHVQALTVGTFELHPNFQVVLRVPRRGRRSMFGDPFFDRPITDMLFGNDSRQPVVLTPPPVDLVVRPPPAGGRPEGYSGAVGSFTFDVQVKPTELTAGEPVTVTSTIRGNGNLEAISAPEILTGDAFKVYTPKLVTKDFDASQSRGSKTFEQVLIPRTEKANEIPALTFSFFDPATEKYKVATRGPFTLNVAPPAEGSHRLVQGGNGPVAQQPEVLGRDIIYLKPWPDDWQQAGRANATVSPLFLGLQAVPPLALALVFFLVRRRNELAQDQAKARRLRAPRRARAALRAANTAARQRDPQHFYESVSAAMAAYFGDRLNLAPGEVSADRVATAFRESKLDEGELQRIEQLFARCERARFAAGLDGQADAADPYREVLADVDRVFKACERTRVGGKG